MIGEKIQSRRQALGLTLAEVGDYVGTTASTVRKWETGFIKNLRTDKIEKLCEVLKVSHSWLLGFSDDLRDTTTDEINELVRIYNALDVKTRVKLLAYAIGLEEAQ